MVLEYSHQKMEKILALFCDARIATLDIVQKEGVYLINYTLVNGYQQKRQQAMKNVMDANLPLRVKMQDTLTQFLENMTLDNVQKMEFHFSILDVTYIDLRMSLILKDESLVPSHSTMSSMDRLIHLFEEYDKLVQDMGIVDLPIPSIFKRSGSGKGRKYIPQTMGSVTALLKSALEA